MQHNFKKIQVNSETSSASIQGFKAPSSKYTDPEINFHFCLCHAKEYSLLHHERWAFNLTPDSTVMNGSAMCLCGLEVEVSFSKQKSNWLLRKNTK